MSWQLGSRIPLCCTAKNSRNEEIILNNNYDDLRQDGVVEIPRSETDPANTPLRNDGDKVHLIFCGTDHCLSNDDAKLDMTVVSKDRAVEAVVSSVVLTREEAADASSEDVLTRSLVPDHIRKMSPAELDATLRSLQQGPVYQQSDYLMNGYGNSSSPPVPMLEANNGSSATKSLLEKVEKHELVLSPPEGKLQPISEDMESLDAITARTKDSLLSTVRTPRGEYVNSSAQFEVHMDEMLRVESLVAQLAGSPLGCIDFVQTFQKRLEDNQIVLLREHGFDGMTFGEVCNRHRRVTLLGIKQGSTGRTIWAPEFVYPLKAEDQMILIECTPFALAMGLAKEASLSESRLSPRSQQLSPAGSGWSPQSPGDHPGYHPEEKPRRCCV